MKNRRPAVIFLVCLALLSLAGLMMFHPIPQDPAYHNFADKRGYFGLPNFWNVISNLPFLIFGTMGFIFCFTKRKTGAYISWTVFFLGTAMVCFGSGYYHWNPDNATLIWDRLPMTIAFMALFVAVVSEQMNEKTEIFLLFPALILGAGSIVWWVHTGDLRFYAWVQFAPLLILPFILILFPAHYSHRFYLFFALGFYILAKVAEFYDHAIFSLTAGSISGHSIKHILASLAPFCIYLMLLRRKPLHSQTA